MISGNNIICREHSHYETGHILARFGHDLGPKKITLIQKIKSFKVVKES